MPTYSFLGYDDNQLFGDGGTPTEGGTITFTSPADHQLVFTDDDAFLEDGLSTLDDEDLDQQVTVYDETGAVETSGQVQPRERIVLDDGTNTYVMYRVYVAASDSYYYIFEEPAPDLNTTYTVTSVTTQNSTPYTSFSQTGVACFARGTRILTPRGWRAVEQLKPGARVMTLDHGAQRVMWVGQRHITGPQLAAAPNLRPYRIRADAIRPGVPCRDLILSPVGQRHRPHLWCVRGAGGLPHARIPRRRGSDPAAAGGRLLSHRHPPARGDLGRGPEQRDYARLGPHRPLDPRALRRCARGVCRRRHDAGAKDTRQSVGAASGRDDAPARGLLGGIAQAATSSACWRCQSAA
ncbi:Hint domain-containing protein [Aestuariicoccus sp. MJ-SS9]|nr:Hint domain-containing protein [Aestuariicoccus sp. MJ-SS9]MDU8912575.1 Hint domain-containing protein [Aestuariicoccus sp. MJ-SS9]